MRHWTAIDAGQTTVRARTSWLPDVITGPGFRDPADDAVAAALTPIRSVLSGLGPVPRPLSLVIGHTGLPESPTEVARLTEAILDLPSVSGPGTDEIDLRLYHDAVAAHAGALGGGPGVVVAAGTGTVCLGIDQTGRTAVVDGVGHWAGDEGSAFDLGRSGLRLAARHLDGRASAPLVSECAHRLLVDDHRLGPDLAAALRRLGRVADRVQLTAGFARQVIDCARAGEPAAAALVDRAAAALADTVAACCARLDPPADGRRIACVGGVFEAGDLVAEPFAAALERVLGPALDGWRIVPAEGTVLDGVVRLACRPTDLHASLQHLQDGPR